MSTCLEPRGLLQQELAPHARAWRIAVPVPLVLAVPWVLLCRGVGAPAEMGTLRGLLLALLLLSATVTDLRRRRIYNWTTYTVLSWMVLLELLGAMLGSVSEGETGFAAAIVAALGILPWRDSLAGFAAGFAIMFVLYNVFRGGAGDLKLVAVLGTLIGANQIIEILIYSYILAGVFAACLVVGVAGPGSVLAFSARTVGVGGRFADSAANVLGCLKRQVPMAPFIAGGTLLALLLR
jgi:Flp pilus assembly protein protease CpaA